VRESERRNHSRYEAAPVAKAIYVRADLPERGLRTGDKVTRASKLKGIAKYDSGDTVCESIEH
jgi:hypothetical protein